MAFQENQPAGMNVFSIDHFSSPVSEFYRDRSVFITGSSGFIGKVLVEKLLRMCPDIKHVYLLMRSKKNVSPKQRTEDLLGSTCFDGLRLENPGVLNKVVCVVGDLLLPELGICPEDIQILSRECSVVFHSAATIKFNESLRDAVELNLIGTRKVAELSRKMAQLKALVHVSTAYAYCDRPESQEVLYPPPMNYQDLISTMKWMSDEMLSSVTPHLISGRPNTYTFTKALTETLLTEEFSDLPLSIVRPSIVCAARNEPSPGWTDNLNGLTGVIASLQNGMVVTTLMNKWLTVDVIPVDMVVDCLIAVAWKQSTEICGSTKFTVYNCTSGSANPITWGRVRELVQKYCLKYPCYKLYRIPDISGHRVHMLYNCKVMVYQLIPAFFVDVFSWLCGKKPRLVKIYQKVQKLYDSLELFSLTEWLMPCPNVTALYDQLTINDQKILNFDVRNVDWNSYFETYVLGIREHIFKDDVTTIPKAKKLLKRMYWNRTLRNYFLVFAFCRVLLWRSDLFRRFCSFQINFFIGLIRAIIRRLGPVASIS